MTDLVSLLSEALSAVCSSHFGKSPEASQVQFQKTRREFEGDITLVVFPLLKLSGKNPEQTGSEIGAALQEYFADKGGLVAGYNVVKGFLNLVIADAYWVRFSSSIATDGSFGTATPGSKPRVLVEFASPNTNKPLHLGHLRNIFLGDSVSSILQANGHTVSRVQIINDRGIHICKSMVAWQHFGNGETPQSAGMKGDKLVGKYYVAFDKEYKQQQQALLASGRSEDEAKAEAPIIREAQEMLRRWEAGDAEVVALWKKMNGWVYEGFDASYHTMGVSFDKLYYESDTYLLGRDEVKKGLESGAFYQKEDGSVWVDLTGEGLDHKALLRKDGTAMYITQDIGTAILRFRDFPDSSYQIYTVGNEQEYHFKVLFRILKKLGWEQAERCYHLSYGMVELPEGKMKSREGTVVDADDIMEEMRQVAREVAEEQGKLDGLSDAEKEALYHMIGMSALKYFLLRVDPVKNMLFNPKESIDFNGHTGPFIQYGYVRTRAILRKFEEQGHQLPEQVSVDVLGSPEKTLLRKLYDFPEVVREAGAKYDPSLIANYAYELTKEFNGFYQQCPILREEDTALRDFRVGLAVRTGSVIRTAMGMLGIGVPERM